VFLRLPRSVGGDGAVCCFAEIEDWWGGG
jgi:hypothetical protein